MNLTEKKYPYCYNVFGICIASDIEFSVLHPSKGKPDVYIEASNIPDHLEKSIKSSVNFQVSNNSLQINIDEIGKIRICKGKYIYYDAIKPEDLKLFILSSGFGALLQQRNILPMHGSSVVIKNKTIMLLGVSGAGKSTLAAYLAKQGNQIIADDISALDTENEKIVILPGIAFSKLWKDATKKLNTNLNNLRKVRESLEKYYLNLSQNSIKEILPLDYIFILKQHNKKDFIVEEVKGTQKFTMLKNNVFRKQFAVSPSVKLAQYQHLTKLAQQCKVLIFTRPKEIYDLDQSFKSISRHL